MVEELEKRMTSWAEVVRRVAGVDDTLTPGGGAAGGLGFCLKSLFHARILPGIEALIELTGLEDRTMSYDLIITGEGKLDPQTGSGKVPMGVLGLGNRHPVPVVGGIDGRSGKCTSQNGTGGYPPVDDIIPAGSYSG